MQHYNWMENNKVFKWYLQAHQMRMLAARYGKPTHVGP